MKKKNLLFLMLTFVLCFMFSLTGCDKVDETKKGDPVVPTYQGMTITKESMINNVKNSAKSSSIGSIKLLSSTTNNEVSSTDIHLEDDETLENDIEDIVEIDVITDDEIKYYVQPNEVFIIDVHISNPYDYEIQSFTLNGKKYANYMFKEGSTMESLLLEVTAPSTSGYVEYTIDAIKYIDGTEIKDVDMSSGDKSIKAGIAFLNAPSAFITSENISTTYIDLGINISDSENLIKDNELSIYLSDGQNVVDKKALKVGVNSIHFDNLTMSTLYEYGIVTAYDLVDGRDTHSDWLLTNTFTTLGAFKISDVNANKTSISFNVARTGEVGNITSISLYDANTKELIKSGNADVRNFTDLLSNHTYNIYVDFEYILNGEKISDWVSYKDVTTVAKVKPTLSFDSSSSDKTSISYNVSTEDTDGILNITKVELLKNNESVKDNGSLLSGSFDGLLSNNKYSVKVSYTYDLNDGQGAISDFITKDVTTVAKVKPTLSISNDEVTDTSINAFLTMNDEDSIGNIDSVKILKNDIVVTTNNEKEISFNSLDYYTDYTVVVEYSYDLNDGFGIQNEKIEKEYKTSPHLEFNNCKIINTSAVSEGETIYMQVSLDNPSGALPSSVVVNGETYNCSGSTTPNKLYVEIVNNGQFEGGNTTLTIERVNMTLDSNNYSIEPSSNNSGSIFINGSLSVESISIVDDANNPVDYCLSNQTMHLYLTLKNKTGYNVDSIVINNKTYTSYTKIDNEHFLIDISLSTAWNQFSISSISYSNAYLTKTLSVGKCSTNRVYKLNTSEVTKISSTEQFVSTTFDGGYYKLTSDIDLSGIEWTNLGTFRGVLDGNGYSIKNMSNVSTITDKDVSIGLFRDIYGVIFNTKLDDVTILMTLTSSTADTYNAYFGGFASGSKFSYNIYALFKNCSVSGDISINNTTGGGAFAGGFVGYEYPYPPFLKIDSCSSNVNINLRNGDSNIGVGAGLVGYFAWASCEIYVYNCSVEGSINASCASVINGTLPWSPDIVDYKNNTCSIYLNGVLTKVIDDKYIYGD